MKTRLFTLLVLLGLAVPAFADTIHLTATTCFEGCWTAPGTILNAPAVSLDFAMTVIPGTGMYWDPFYSSAEIPASFAVEVIGLEGTFNGEAMTLMPNVYGDGRGWAFATGFRPGLITFSMGGLNDFRLFWDHSSHLLNGPGIQVPLIYTRVAVPESSILGLLTVGLIGLAGVIRRYRA